MLPTNRRLFLLAMAAGAALPNDAWKRVPQILARTRPPVFPKRDFEITRYGADGDGAKDCSEAFKKAIAACNAAGGGRVVVPAGRFLTGPIHLKSKVNLHLAGGATILFSRDPAAYLPAVFTRWEGTECMNFSPFVYAYGQENIAITGTGTLDGQADCEHWWPWKGRSNCGWSKGQPDQNKARQRLMQLGQQGVPPEKRVFGRDDYLRPQFIQPYRSRNILIEGISIRNSPMYEVHPVLSSNVTVRGVNISSHGPNNDGCDPECCRDVLIEKCVFDTGDDCIAIKSGRNQDGRRVGVPSENILVRGCRMKDGHGGVTIGSEISGGAHNIFAEDCHMDSPHLDYALRIKTNAMRGGVIENVHARNIDVGQVAQAAILIDFYYEEGSHGPYKPVVRDIEVSHLTCRKSKYALYLRAFADAPIRNVTLEDCTFENVAQPNVVEHVEDLVLRGVKINGV